MYSVRVVGNRYLIVVLFVFQAEDGIRDLVRSRGLGDVYKRQKYYQTNGDDSHGFNAFDYGHIGKFETRRSPTFESVSYTHLTLPTSDLV